MYDVVALGELLVDFTDHGVSGQGNPLFEANPGGAPCNVLAMLAKFGKKTAFIGKVGNDMFGRLLKRKIEDAGIAAKELKEDPEVNTTLAFIHTLPDGDREFFFFRNPGADRMLREEEVNAELIQNAEIFHFGTLSMTHEGVRAATRKAAETAKKSGCLISFDPNLREALWESPELAREQILYGIQMCDILKISDNEIRFLTGKEDCEEGIACLRNQYPIPLVLLTRGKDGSIAYYKHLRTEEQGFQVHATETTGAGDTFFGCCLAYILEHDFQTLTERNLHEMLLLANAGAALITTRKGALCVMPEKEEILKLIQETSRT